MIKYIEQVLLLGSSSVVASCRYTSLDTRASSTVFKVNCEAMEA